MKKLGFGLMRLPLSDAGNPQSIDLPQVCRMTDCFLEKGFTYFDTAYPYHQGTSEVAARKALVERHPRASFTLADKMPTWLITDSGDYQKYFDEQLARCGVDYFDYYLLHALDKKNYADTLKHGGFAFMQRLKAEGKVKRAGFSFHDKAEVLEQILAEHPEMEFVQLQINYVDWESKSVEARRCYETATKHHKPVIVMEPVKGGLLAALPPEAERLFKAARRDASTASWALRYAASLDNVAVVLSGMSNFDQLADNVSHMQDFAPLDGAERKVVEAAAELLNAGSAIPCTACQYCVDGCPQNIPIPKYFTLYNDRKRFRLAPNHANSYRNLAQSHGKAGDCIECGQCEAACPQHLKITELLKEVSAVFDAPAQKK
ncbi:aldo/keto reductase [Treponema endosymbiont of Eucomonympha sp.]|uniref:aldo/keto reductase n=1 Tax=Treponema endosymbiont of Eucomonympha sp. TaxID=1580831 RepID=UPI000783C32C|nr:aldo/keto reductase [Treponema endosymbiont of Eucomonympha sp.]